MNCHVAHPPNFHLWVILIMQTSLIIFGSLRANKTVSFYLASIFLNITRNCKFASKHSQIGSNHFWLQSHKRSAKLPISVNVLSSVGFTTTLQILISFQVMSWISLQPSCTFSTKWLLLLCDKLQKSNLKLLIWSWNSAAWRLYQYPARQARP